jgi:farnesyl-diphosphate farnesyltransferase
MPDASNQSIAELLEGVSRSFYKTLWVLPGAVRTQISLAYLLARATDTIADTDLVPQEKRLAALDSLRARILGTSNSALDFRDLSRNQASLAEKNLLESIELCLALLTTFSPADQELIRKVLDTITSGQELDLRRFARSSPENVVALEISNELDDYTYRVAGCVGAFWTKMCRAHLFPKAALDDTFLLTNGVRFGKGLQLVNILRDLPVDLRQGRCYLPSQELATVGLKPADLLNPARESDLRAVYNSWLERAKAHLQAGWNYTNALPRGSVRVRLACAWPLLLGFETLRLLRSVNVLAPEPRVKVGRSWFKRMILRSVLCYPLPGAWQRLAPGA